MDSVDTVPAAQAVALTVQIAGIDRLLADLREAGAEAEDAGALHRRWQQLERDRQRLALALRAD